MEIVWTAEAERHVSALADSFLQAGDARAAGDFVRKTMDVVGRLADAPYTGQRLAGRSSTAW